MNDSAKSHTAHADFRAAAEPSGTLGRLLKPLERKPARVLESNTHTQRLKSSTHSKPLRSSTPSRHHSRGVPSFTSSKKRQHVEEGGRPATRPRLSDAASSGTFHDPRPLRSHAREAIDRRTSSKSGNRHALMDVVLDRRQEALGLEDGEDVALDNVAIAMLLAPRLRLASSLPSGPAPHIQYIWSGSFPEISPPSSIFTFPDSFERHTVNE
ncbi:hypothetical protein BD626DRAFT_565059 [Schizophyllum amplum]|uniref:Uncharacterized protein n=1 Tax=Schizophyllum amplum TaxID=97359 RepID=A0A550CTT5_9AGAR|nr:hypothetical protein BD626DRAFT_565059 [Auriculariopsis ampla]